MSSGQQKTKDQMIKRLTKTFAIATGAVLLAGTAMAGGGKGLVINDKQPIAHCIEDPEFCKIFDALTLYDNKNAKFIQKVNITTRYHGQHHATSLNFDGLNGGQDVGASFWEHRRFRHGIKVKLLNDFTLWNEWNSPSDDLLVGNRFLQNIDEIGIKWAPSKDFFVSVGKQKLKIGREWATSSKVQLTPERSHIINEVIASTGKPYGINTGFKAFGIKHQLGAWLAGTENSRRELTFDTNGGASYLAEVPLNGNTDLHFGYLFTNNGDGEDGGQGSADRLELSPYNHVFALGTESHWDIGHCDRKFGLYTDLIYGIDRETQGGNDAFANDNDIAAGEDTFGLYVLPYFDITERLQLVGRYAYATSTRIHRGQRAPFDEDRDGLSNNLGGRPNLEDVHTFYIGGNYRLCGDHLKLIGGYEYTTGDVRGDNGGFTGDTWIFGVRTYF